MIAAIVLSGGASLRMGTPKALLKFRGSTFLETALEVAFAAGLKPRVVVLGHDADKILSGIVLGADVSIALSADLAAGPIGSIRAGIRSVLNHPVEGALVWHVDRPHIRLDTIRTLVDAFQGAHPPVVLPVYQGLRGHPAIFAREAFQPLLDAPDDEGARAVVHAYGEQVLEVAVDDPAVLADIDTPQAYQDLLRRLDTTSST